MLCIYEELNEIYLSDKNASASGGFNSSFSGLAEKFSLDNDRLMWESSSSKDFEKSSLGDVDNWGLILDGGVFLSGFFSDQVPESVKIDGWEEVSVLLHSENSDATLSEVARVTVRKYELEFEKRKCIFTIYQMHFYDG